MYFGNIINFFMIQLTLAIIFRNFFYYSTYFLLLIWKKWSSCYKNRLSDYSVSLLFFISILSCRQCWEWFEIIWYEIVIWNYFHDFRFWFKITFMAVILILIWNHFLCDFDLILCFFECQNHLEFLTIFGNHVSKVNLKNLKKLVYNSNNKITLQQQL